MRREFNVQGMDCAGCARTVQSVLEYVPGVHAADVRLMSETVVVELDEDAPASRDAVVEAIESAGYRVAENGALDPGGASRDETAQRAPTAADASGMLSQTGGASLGLLAASVVLVLGLAGAGHGLGWVEWLEARMPAWAGLLGVLALGYPVFSDVLRSVWNGRITAHAMMTVGVAAACVAGAWATAFVIVIFMRLGDYVEHATTDRARESIRSLVREAPQTAIVERDGEGVEISADDVQEGDICIVRPGQKIPVDGVVEDGHATINQSAITGEPMPVEATAGDRVYAATIARGGALRIRTTEAGDATTFGRVVQMVEAAESHRGDTERWADRFSAYYLPAVGGLAGLTYLVTGDAMSTVAVLVVACSCAFALATPVAMLASIGVGARRGLLVKGGRFLETLASADVLLVDKTGTLTVGRPEVTDVRTFDGASPDDILRLAASAERFAEHPLAGAVREAADARGLSVASPDDFESVPGRGIRARVDQRTVVVGNRRMLEETNAAFGGDGLAADGSAPHLDTEAAGETHLFVSVDGMLQGVIVTADRTRSGVAEALEETRDLGIRHVEVLTGDRTVAAEALADRLGLPVRAELLPEDKIDAVRQHQADGRTVVMVGDGVNDAPALAQADVGIAMGAAGTDLAIDTAPVVLMREDWALIPDAIRTARRTMRVVKGNFWFTGVYNVVALGLAAAGILPPVLAAAMHSIPDLGILANSSRLLRTGGKGEE